MVDGKIEYNFEFLDEKNQYKFHLNPTLTTYLMKCIVKIGDNLIAIALVGITVNNFIATPYQDIFVQRYWSSEEDSNYSESRVIDKAIEFIKKKTNS